MTSRPIAAIVPIFIGASLAAAVAVWPAPIAAQQPITVPFEYANRHLVVQASVSGSQPLPFVLDTGAGSAIIKLERARALGLELYGTVGVGGAGSGRASTGSQVRGASWTMPGVPRFSQPVTFALPLAGLASGLGRDADGIIGSEFIKQFVVEIDYEASHLRLHDKGSFRYAGPGESVPLQFNSDGHPTIEAIVTPLGGAPIAGRFLFDTGSGGAVVLHTPLVTRHRLLDDSATNQTIRLIGAQGAGGSIAGRIGRLAEIRIGAFRIAKPITMFSQDQAGSFANADLAGNIGNQIASRFRIFLDYGRRRMILESSPTFAEPFDRAFSGLAFRAEGADYRTFRIRDVLERSPASEAGLQPGDVIAEVDGKPASAFTLTALIEMFERPVAYVLTVRRGEQTLTTTLTPRKMV